MTTLLQLKHVTVVGSVPTAGGSTTPIGTPGGGGGIPPIWGCVLVTMAGGCGYTPGAVNCLGGGCVYGPEGIGSLGGATKPYCGLPTTAEYGGGRSSGAEAVAVGPWLVAISFTNIFGKQVTIGSNNSSNCLVPKSCTATLNFLSQNWVTD